MGIHRRILALTQVLFLWLLAASAPAQGAGCVACHGSHFVGRGSCVGCHGGHDGTGHLRVAHQGLLAGRYAWSAIPGSAPVTRGKRRIEELGCLRCHKDRAKGTGLAADLATVPHDRTASEIAAFIEKPARFMPDFHLDGGGVTDLVNAILAGRGPIGGEEKERPVVVHFQRDIAPNAFEKRCGACHRALSARLGGMGRGASGPNLSGLFTPWYPYRLDQGRRWTPESMKKWLENPRKMRSGTMMPPVALSAREFDEATGLLVTGSRYPYP